MKNKKILVIGGTGALGQTLINRYKDDNKLFVFSRKEHTQEELKLIYPEVKFKIGNIKDKDSISRTILEFKPEIIVNAAALKTVWVCQDNPYESVLTNIIGHQNLMDCVSQLNHNIEALIFVSTDKACSPINVYGMSKAIAEQLYVDFSRKQDSTKCILVRYGNVLNSTGSIIPVFKRMIMSGQRYLPITDARMTRFLLTLQQATDVIDWAYNHSDSNGKIAIPKIKSLKLVDIAKEIGKACGVDDIEFKKIPIRDGEKLHEEMISKFERQRTVEYNNYFLIGHERITEHFKDDAYSSENSLAENTEKLELLKTINKFVRS